MWCVCGKQNPIWQVLCPWPTYCVKFRKILSIYIFIYLSCTSSQGYNEKALEVDSFFSRNCYAIKAKDSRASKSKVVTVILNKMSVVFVQANPPEILRAVIILFLYYYRFYQVFIVFFFSGSKRWVVYQSY